MSDLTPINVVEVGNARLAYRLDGPPTAPTLVFSNSLGLDWDMWQPQVNAFGQQFRLLRYDSRGHGRSTISPGPYTIEMLGRDLVAILDAAEVERAYVCGISLGGMVAQWLTAHHPERVVRAVFANTGACIGTSASWEDRIARVRSGGMSAIREPVMSRFFSTPFRVRHPEVDNRISAMLSAINPDGYIATCQALRDADIRGSVGRIHTPTLIMTGALDESTPIALSQELHAAIPGSELMIIPDCAHLSNLEAADTVNEQALRFFE